MRFSKGIKISFFLSALVAGLLLTAWTLGPKTYQYSGASDNLDIKEVFLKEKVIIDSTKERPNIIIIVADDLGKTDISLYGNTIVHTPNIDSLAIEGVKFEEGYVTSPICSPSRAGLLTGRYQQRFGHELQPSNRYLKNRLEKFIVEHFVDLRELELELIDSVPDSKSIGIQGLPLGEITIADLLKKTGYKTGIVGKWHLGASEEYLPLKRGFDEHYGFYEAFSWYADPEDDNIVNVKHAGIMDSHIWDSGNKGAALKRRNNTLVDNKEYLTNTLATEATSFIDKNKDNPFFLYVPFNTPHTPFQALKSDVEKYKAAGVSDLNKAVYYAMISGLDRAVGQIRRKLKETSIERNTIIFFISDNGGATYTEATNNSPLRGGKMSLYEGGINVPFTMTWIGKIQPQTVYSKPVSVLDIFATAAAVSGSVLPQGRTYDGVNLLPFIAGKDTTAPHQILYWRSGTNKAIRKGEWKLVLNLKDGIEVLYNLKTDKNEKINLASVQRLKVEELKKDLEAWEKTLVKPLWPSNGYYRNISDGKLDRYSL